MNLSSNLVSWFKLDETSSSWKIPVRYGSNPIINYGGGGWKNSQVQEPIVLTDPTDSTKLVMFFAGMAAPVSAGTMSIGRATASISNPYLWSEYSGNPIITGSNRRLDSVIYNITESKYYLYSTNEDTDSIDLLNSSNGITFTLTSSVLTPTGQGRNDGTTVSQGTVVFDNGTWYMFYCYRNGGIILPGIRIATSSNGVIWSKVGSDVLITGSAGNYDDQYIEWHSILKQNSTFFMAYEAYSGTNWSINLAYTNDLTQSWTKNIINPIFQKSGTPSSFDQYHVATPLLFQSGSTILLFYQGANLLSPYSDANWAMGIATLSSSLTNAITKSVIDSSPYNNNGISVETISDSNGKIGRAFSFQGSSSVKTLNTSFDFSTNKDFSYSVWIKPNFSSTSNVGSAIIDFTDPTFVRTYLRWESSTLGFYTDISSTGGGSAWRTSSPSFVSGSWHLLQFVHSASNSAQYYFDGVPVTTTTVISTARTVKNNPITIGFGATNNYYWNGSMDDVRIYDRKLTLQEIQYLYNYSARRQSTITWI